MSHELHSEWVTNSTYERDIHHPAHYSWDSTSSLLLITNKWVTNCTLNESRTPLMNETSITLHITLEIQRHLSCSYEWVTSHIWMSHVTCINESCHTYEWVMSLMSHIWMSHVTHMNESWHTHEWFMSHIWMSHGAHINESCHTYEWVMSHLWLSHVTHMNESCHT